MTRAATLEEEIIHRPGGREFMSIVEEILIEDDDMSEKATISRRKPKPPFPPYHSCGSTTHRRKDCSKLQATCYKCQKIGHISTVCRNMAMKDEQGRVRTVVASLHLN